MNSWYEIKNEGDNDLTIYLYDVIGGWGVNANALINEIKASKSKNISLRINSAGGSVFQALALYHFLKNSDLNVTAYIEGLAASAATIVALGAGEVKMAENSLFMIHNPFMGYMMMANAGAEELREIATELNKDADFLDKIKQQLANIYSKKTKKSDKSMSKLMDAETWFDAQEAKEAGFVDEIVDKIKIAANIDLKEMQKNGYKNIPQDKIELLNKIQNTMDFKAEFQNLKSWVESKIESVLNNGTSTEEKPIEVKILDNEEVKNKLTAFEAVVSKAMQTEAELTQKNTEIVTLKARITELEKEIPAKELPKGAGAGTGKEENIIDFIKQTRANALKNVNKR